MTHREWQQDGKDNRLNETRILAAHFLHNGVLLTMRWRVPGLSTDMINQETTFLASLEQAEDIAQALLAHIASMRAAIQP